MRLLSFVVTILILATATMAQPEPIVIDGSVIATDGDSLIMDRKELRLWGIDAPEMNERRGPISRRALDRLVMNKNVSCELIGDLSQEPTAARCYTEERGDLSTAMLFDGYAFHLRKETLGTPWAEEYHAAESRAAEIGFGFWQIELTPDDSLRKKLVRVFSILNVLLGAILGGAFAAMFMLWLQKPNKDE